MRSRVPTEKCKVEPHFKKHRKAWSQRPYFESTHHFIRIDDGSDVGSFANRKPDHPDCPATSTSLSRREKSPIEDSEGVLTTSPPRWGEKGKSAATLRVPRARCVPPPRESPPPFVQPRGPPTRTRQTRQTRPIRRRRVRVSGPPARPCHWCCPTSSGTGR